MLQIMFATRISFQSVHTRVKYIMARATKHIYRQHAKPLAAREQLLRFASTFSVSLSSLVAYLSVSQH